MQRWIKRIFVTGFWGFLALTWIIIGVFYYQGSRPASEDSETQVFEVQPGMTLKQVAVALSRQGLIRSASAFQAIAYIQSKQKQVMVGEFSLSPSMLPAEIILRITSGKTVLYPVTIPEGYRITEIAALLHEQGLGNPDTFIRETEPLDQVTVYRPRSGEGTLRVTSVMLDLDKVSFSIYTQLIAEQISSMWKQR